MADPARKRPTFEELYASIAALPGMTGEILEPGVLRVMSRPVRGHRKAHKAIVDALREHDVDRGGRGWWIEVEPEVRIGDLLMVPDVAGWRVERVAEMPADNPIAIVPDWICEILSPSTERDDRRLKLPHYASTGVAHVWLVERDRAGGRRLAQRDVGRWRGDREGRVGASGGRRGNPYREATRTTAGALGSAAPPATITTDATSTTLLVPLTGIRTLTFDWSGVRGLRTLRVVGRPVEHRVIQSQGELSAPRAMAATRRRVSRRREPPASRPSAADCSGRP